MEFVPVFFPKRASEEDGNYVSNCITAFCFIPETDKPYLTYNQKFVESLLEDVKIDQQFDFISILFGFIDLIDEVFEPDDVILTIRKLYSVSYYASQLIQFDSIRFYNDIASTFEILLPAVENRPDLHDMIIGAINYALFVITPRLRDSKLLQPDIEYIVNTALFIKDKTEIAMRKKIVEFLYNAFFCFDGEAGTDLVIQDVIKSITITIRNNFEIEFNYMAFVAHLISLLSTQLSYETKSAIFLLVSLVTEKHGDIVDFVLDNDNMDIISDFLCDMISLTLQNPPMINPVRPYLGEISKEMTKVGLPKSFQYDPHQPKPSPRPNERPGKFGVKLISILFHSIVAICASSQDKSSKSLEMIARMLVTSNTLTVAIFCSKMLYMITITKENMEAVHPILASIFEIAFLFYNDENLINFSLMYLQKQLSLNTTCIELYLAALEVYIVAAQDFMLSPNIVEIVQIAMNADNEYFDYAFESLQATRITGQTLINYVSCFYVENSDEMKQYVFENLSNLIDLINVFFSSPRLTLTFIHSIDFISAIIKTSYVRELFEYSATVLVTALSKLKKSDPAMFLIFDYFVEVLQNQEQYFVTFILDLFINIYPENSIELSSLLTQTQFIQESINVASRHPENIPLIFKLFSTCSSESTAPMFHLLSKAISEEDADRIGDDLFQNNFKNCISSLPVLYDIFGPKMKLLFIERIMVCCRASEKTTIEINSSLLPTKAIATISEYRHKDKTDELFDSLCNFISYMGQKSLKSSDLLSLIQALTPLPGNFRPKFSIQILNTLHNIFENTNLVPTSLFKLYGNAMALPDVSLTRKVTEFSYTCEVKFRGAIGNILRLTCTNGVIISFDYGDKQISITMKDNDGSTIRGAFNFEFTKGQWFKLAIVYKQGVFSLYIRGEKKELLMAKNVFLEGQIVKSGFGSLLIADFGSFALFSCSLTDEEIALLYKFPLVPCSFAPAEQDDYDNNFAPLFTGKLYDNSIFSYNASLIINNSYAVNMAPLPVTGRMLKLDCQTFSFPSKPKAALSLIGGPSIFLPLFAQLDMPLIPEENKPVDYTIDPVFLPILLTLIKCVLAKSAKNQENFMDYEGFRILSYLIAKSKLQHITEEVIIKLKEIFQVLMIVGLGRQMLQHIWFNPRLWIYLPKDLQMFVYKTIDDIFETVSIKRKVWFAQTIPYSRVLCYVKVCYWTNYCDKEYNCLNEPKVDPITKEVEAERDCSIMKEIRDYLMVIGDKLAKARFTLGDATTLIHLCLDKYDIELSKMYLTTLMTLMNERIDFILPATRTNFKFQTFYPLFTSPDQEIRILAFHIVMRSALFDKELKNQFLPPFSFSQWIKAICCTFNMTNNDETFADIVWGYLFGLFDNKQFTNMPPILVSSGQMENYSITYEFLLPLALLVISEFEDEKCLIYIKALYTAIQNQYQMILKKNHWVYSFIFFIVTRLNDKSGNLDETSNFLIDVLLFVYMQNVKSTVIDINTFKEINYTLINLSYKTNIDYSFLMKIILTKFVTNYVNEKSTKTLIDDFFSSVWYYLFMIPSTSGYFLPCFSEQQPPEYFKKVQYSDCVHFYLSTTPIQVNFCYSIRTKQNGEWLDSDLAELCLSKMRNLTLNGEQRTMMSFILGRGLAHPNTFSTFMRYIRNVTKFIVGHSDNDLSVLVCYMSGLIKCYNFTENGHPSHLYLQEDSQAFHKLIHFAFKESTKWGTSLQSFESGFKSTGHNFSHEILMELVKTEQGIDSTATKLKQNINEYYERGIKSNQKYSIIFKLIHPDPNTRQDAGTEQVKSKLIFIADDVKNDNMRGLSIYTRLWHSLGYGNGIWKSTENDSSVHWKISNFMTRKGRRGRLVMNYNFDDHKNASLLRDLGNPLDAAEQYKKHMAEMRLTSFSDNSGVSIIPEDSIIFERDENDMEQLFKIEAKLIRMRKVYSGHLIIYKNLTVFESKDGYKALKTGNIEIRYIFLRQYLLLETAIEIFSTKSSMYIDFSIGQREKVLNILAPLCTKAKFIQRKKEDIKVLVDKATNKWRNNKISNFDYLMKLNIFSGRSYNDLSKYPVFPWIIQDYKSSKLDLNDRNSYRDLSKPIGAINQERLSILEERLDDSFSQEDQFLYGAFYSSAAVVIGYLIRIEPFTSLHIELQSGKFDIADRLFNGIANAWECCNKVSMDFRELIPEFFYFPDFLNNDNGFDLGKVSATGDVALPPWATDAQDFIAKNAAALESPIVSEMLPRWIDLIFGITSRGQGAIKAKNVFCKNFYDTSVTPEVMKNPTLLSFAREYAACFGSAGYQLFFEPHRQKVQPIQSFPLDNFYENYKLSNYPLVAVAAIGNSLISVDSMMNVSCFDINTKGFSKYNFPSRVLPDFVDIGLQSQLVTILDTKIIFGFTWSPHINTADIKTGKIIQTKKYHAMPVTCITADKHLVISSAQDATVVIKHKTRIFTFTKHRAPVKCVAFSSNADQLISASIDGTVILLSLSREKDTHSFHIDGVPLFAGMSDSGSSAIVYFNEVYKIIFFDQNLLWPKVIDLSNQVDAFVVFSSPDGNSYVALSVRGTGIVVYNMANGKQCALFMCDATTLNYDKSSCRLIRGTMYGEISLMNIVNVH